MAYLSDEKAISRQCTYTEAQPSDNRSCSMAISSSDPLPSWSGQQQGHSECYDAEHWEEQWVGAEMDGPNLLGCVIY